MSKEKKSISQLEGWYWNTEIPTETNSSYEEYNFYLLHNKPLKHYTPEDIHFMLVQGSGLKYMVPLAIEILNSDVLIKAESYPSDLLSTVMFIPEKFWKENPNYYNQVYKLIQSNRNKIDDFHSTKSIEGYLRSALNNFLNLNIRVK